MPAVERRITIEASAAKVFAYLGDFTRHSEWSSSHPLQLRQTSSGPVGVGTTFSSVARQMGREFHATIPISEFVPNRRIVFETDEEVGRFRHYFPLEGGLTKGARPLHRYSLFKLLGAIFTPFVPHIFDNDLKRIKAKVEGEGAA